MPATARARDTQRSKVYAWESARFEISKLSSGSSGLSLEECKALVRRVYQDHGYPPPTVEDGRGRKRACGSYRRIALPRWSRSEWVVLHECAHGLVMHLDPAAAWHGPLFVRIYVDLLARYLRLPKGELAASARKAGVKIAPSADVSACR